MTEIPPFPDHVQQICNRVEAFLFFANLVLPEYDVRSSSVENIFLDDICFQVHMREHLF